MPRRMNVVFLSLVVLATSQSLAEAREPVDRASTFSIIAFDPERKEWGVAVASKYIAVGAVVPHARAGVGAVATQSAVNISYGPRGLDLMAKGMSAEDALKKLLEEDKGKDYRQVAFIDAKGNIARFTGSKCVAWAGDRAGKNYSIQGNLLAGEKVLDAMADAFEKQTGPLAWRLMAALEAGDRAGGDKRGKQAAGILVVREGAGPNGISDRYLDLRVDDHREPVEELARILSLRIKRPRGKDLK